MANYGSIFDPNGNIMEPSPTQTIRDDLSTTLRSVRDTLSTSFQTLNLTMSSIHNTLRTMASSMPRANVQANPNYVPAYGAMMLTGGLSNPMAQHIATNSMFGLATGEKPFNVLGMEYGWQRQLEMQHRMTQLGTDASFAIPNMALGTLAGWGLTRWAGSSRAPGMMRSIAGSGMGRIALGGAGMMAAGMLLDPIAGAYSDAAQTYGRDIAGIRRMSVRYGNEFTNRQSAQVARGITNYGYREMMAGTDFDTKIGADGMRNVLMQGLQQNLFQGKTPEDLTKQMESAAQVVKFFTGVLGSKDVQEAMQQMGALKSMGVNPFQSPGFMSQMGTSTYKYSQMMGVPGAQLLQQAAQVGHNAYSQYGMPGFGGIMPTMQNMALAHELEKRRLLSSTEIAAGGGHNAIAGQITNFTAGMMQHGGIGKLMLAAGWAGGGKFDMGRFNDSIQQGYFPTMHNAFGAIAGNPKKFAKFMMNQENLHASAAEQGGLDEMVEQMFGEGLSNVPGMDDEDSYAFMIKRVAEQNGIQLSTAAAKQIAIKRFRPGAITAMNKEANRHRDRGLYHENALRFHRFRGIGEAGEAIEKVPGALYEQFINSPAQGMYDMWNKFMGEPDSIRGVIGTSTGQFNGNMIDNMAKFMNGPSPNYMRVGVNERAYQDAFRMSDREFNLGSHTGFFGSSRMFSSREAFGMAPAVSAIATRQHKDYFDAMMDPNSMSSSEAFSRFGNYFSGKDVNSVLADYKNSREYHGKMAGGFHYLLDNMDNSTINDATSYTQGRDWFKNLGADSAFTIMQQAGIDLSKYDKTKKDELMQRMLDSQNPVLAEYARNNGVSMRNLAYGTVTKYFGGDEGMSNYHRFMGANDQAWAAGNRVGAIVAKDVGDTFGNDKFKIQSENGMSIGLDQVQTSLNAIGLGYDDIQKLAQSEGGADQLRMYGGLIEKLHQGENLNANDWDSVSDPLLKQRLDAMSKKGKYKLQGAVRDDSFLGGQGNLDDKLQFLLANAGRSATLDNAYSGVHDILGFDEVTKDTVAQYGSRGSLAFADYIEGLRGGNKQGKDLQSKLRAVRGSDIASLREEYNIDASVSDDKVKDTIRKSLMNTTLEQAQKEVDTKPKRGSLESTVDPDKSAIRVTWAGFELSKAEEKGRNYANSNPGGGSYTPVRSGGINPGSVNSQNSNSRSWWDSIWERDNR